MSKEKKDTKTIKEEGTENSELSQELEQLRLSHLQAVAQSQRALADYANLKKRYDKEKQEIGSFVIESVMSQLLPTLDNLNRAVQYASEEDRQSPLYQGLHLTMQQLDQIFSDIGIHKIEAGPGADFDPSIHEAVDVAEGPQGKIITELSTGFTINSKVIRPARVTVGQSASS